MATVVAAFAGALGAYVAAARRLSGKVATSEAASLWEESASIRADYRERLVEAEKRMAHQEERIGKLEERKNELERENLDLIRRGNECIDRCDAQDRRIEELLHENASLKNTIRKVIPDA